VAAGLALLVVFGNRPAAPVELALNAEAAAAAAVTGVGTAEPTPERVNMSPACGGIDGAVTAHERSAGIADAAKDTEGKRSGVDERACACVSAKRGMGRCTGCGAVANAGLA